MEVKEGRLFTLELRIRNQRIKLAVNESDSLNDLFERLASKVSLNHKYSETVRGKLETGLRTMADSPACSEKVRNKLQELTEESKIVILGVTENNPVEQSLNETPFKILMDTSYNFRKHSVEQTRRNYLQDSQGSPALKRNYNKPISQIIYERQDAENYESYPKQQWKNNFSDRNYHPIYNSPQSPEKCFKRYGYRTGQEISKDCSPFTEINTNRSITYNPRNEYQGKMTANAVNTISNDFHEFKRFPITSKSIHPEVIQSYSHQANKSQDRFSRQQSAQNLRRKYTSNQLDTFITTDYKKQQGQPQKLTSNYKFRSFEEKSTYPGKKFSYLEEDEF